MSFTLDKKNAILARFRLLMRIAASWILVFSLSFPLSRIAYADDEIDKTLQLEDSTKVSIAEDLPAGGAEDESAEGIEYVDELFDPIEAEVAGSQGASGDRRDEGVPVSNEEFQEEWVSDEVIVACENTGSPNARSFDGGGAKTLEEEGVQVVGQIAAATEKTGAIVSVKVPASASIEESVADLESVPGVAYAQPDYLYRLIDGIGDPSEEGGDPVVLTEELGGSVSVDDPLCNNSTAYNANQYYLYQSKTVDAWNMARSDRSVTIAVLDTGCRLDHVDLAGVIDFQNAYDAYHGVPLSQSPIANGDVQGHGTHVSGIAGAQANNGLGIAGASYNASILPIKVFNDLATSSARAKTSDILKAYKYLERLMDEGNLNNLRVVNLSLGYYPASESNSDRVFEAAIESLRDSYGVLTVCAGGNGDAYGNPRTDRSLPSDFDACLAVTSLDRESENSYWSDYNEYKDISAPGALITSASNVVRDGYRTLSGSSMASPLVSGIASLMWAASPNLSVDQVVAAIESTADPVQDSANDRTARSGSYGAINAVAAVKSVLSGSAQNAVLVVDHASIPNQTYGYDRVKPITFAVRNVGNAPASDLHVAIEVGSSSFVAGSLTATTLEPGAQATFTCTLKSSLNAGTYSGRVRVSDSAQGTSAVCTFEQSVVALDISSGKLYEQGASLPGVAAKDWSGRPCVLESGWSVKAGGTTLHEPNVTVTYENNVKAAAANSSAAPTVTVKAATPNLVGSFKVKFSIRKVSHWGRLGGTTAFDTMALISQKSYPHGADTVVIATYDGYWDALTASGIASFEEAPILLTRTNELSGQTENEIRRLTAKKAVIVGGPAVVSQEVEKYLCGMGLSVTRYYGEAAADTAVQVAQSKRGQWGKTAVVATSNGYWDALSIAPYSYAKKAPVFLSQGASNVLSASSLEAIRAGGFTRVVIAGGSAVVSSRVEGQIRSLGILCERVWGDTASLTSLAVARFAIEEGMTARQAGVATLGGHWDALTGAALCGKCNSILMLASDVDSSCIDGMIALSESGSFLVSRGANLQYGYVFGGTAVVSNSIVRGLESMYVGP